MKSNVQLSEQWLRYLHHEFDQDYMKSLKAFLKNEIDRGKTIYPHPKDIFQALELTPPEAVKVVILGQDPYHGPGQAHGLSFSVRPGVRPPPSLQNIYKELNLDLKMPIPNHGHLESWARQGVLLLNAVLTVEAHQAASHQKRGWESFTDRVIQTLNEHFEGIVFMLWGSHAQKKGAIINPKRHFVLKAPHPSPLSAHRGFLGCGHFSKANRYLSEHGKSPIQWESLNSAH